MSHYVTYGAFAALLLAALCALSWIDIRKFRLPDSLTLPLIILGALQSYLLWDALRASLIGAAAGYSIFVGVEYAFKALRGKDGLGRGDAKLLAAGGAWCGWTGLPSIILIASTGGLIFALLAMKPIKPNPEAPKAHAGDRRIPFGPFLAAGIAMVWLANSYVSLGS